MSDGGWLREVILFTCRCRELGVTFTNAESEELHMFSTEPAADVVFEFFEVDIPDQLLVVEVAVRHLAVHSMHNEPGFIVRQRRLPSTQVGEDGVHPLAFDVRRRYALTIAIHHVVGFLVLWNRSDVREESGDLSGVFAACVHDD